MKIIILELYSMHVYSVPCSTQHDTEMLSHHTTHVNTDTGGRYTTGHFTPAPKSLDDKVVNLVQDDVPADSYDEVEALVPL